MIIRKIGDVEVCIMPKRVKQEDLQKHFRSRWKIADLAILRILNSFSIIRYKRYWYPIGRSFGIWDIKKDMFVFGSTAHLVLMRKIIEQR